MEKEITAQSANGLEGALRHSSGINLTNQGTIWETMKKTDPVKC